MNLAEAHQELALAQAALDAAESRAAAARRAFVEAPQVEETDAARSLMQLVQDVEVERLRVGKRQAAVAEAEQAERNAAEKRSIARIAELRASRPAFLLTLHEAIRGVVLARRAFAAAVDAVHVVVDVDNERVAELRQLDQLDPFTEIDVVRHAIGQLIEREAPSEPAILDDLPGLLSGLVDRLAGSPTDEFEADLHGLRNAFAALTSPSVADFCVAQRLPLPGDHSPMALNARNGAALLREIEENQS